MKSKSAPIAASSSWASRSQGSTLSSITPSGSGSGSKIAETGRCGGRRIGLGAQAWPGLRAVVAGDGGSGTDTSRLPGRRPPSAESTSSLLLCRRLLRAAKSGLSVSGLVLSRRGGLRRGGLRRWDDILKRLGNETQPKAERRAARGPAPYPRGGARGSLPTTASAAGSGERPARTTRSRTKALARAAPHGACGLSGPTLSRW